MQDIYWLDTREMQGFFAGELPKARHPNPVHLRTRQPACTRDCALRIVPPADKMCQTVSRVSGSVVLDGSGKGKGETDIPCFDDFISLLYSSWDRQSAFCSQGSTFISHSSSLSKVDQI